MPTQWAAGTRLWESTVTNASNRSDYLPGLKEDYIDAFDAFLNSPLNLASNRFARRRDRMGGRRTVTEVPTRRPAGVGYRGEFERLPWPYASTSVNLFITAKKMSLRHRMTWELMAAAAKGKSVIFERDPWSRDMEQLREHYALMRNENILWGRANILGVVSAFSENPASGGVDTARLTLYGRNARRSTAASFFRRGAFPHPFYVNQLLAKVPTANGLYSEPLNTARAMRVTSVTNTDQEAPTIDVQDVDGDTGLDGTTDMSDTWTLIDGDYLIPFGDRRRDTGAEFAVPATSDEMDSNLFAMNGIMDYVMDSALQSSIMGGSKSTVEGLRSNHLRGSPAGTQRNFQERGVGLQIRIGQQRSGKTINRLYCAPSIMDEWFKENANLRRFETIMGSSGWEDLKIAMHGVMVGPDVDWQFADGCVVGYNTGFGGYFEQRPLGPPMPGEERWVQDYDLRETILLQSGNTMRTRPFAESLYDDLNFHAYDLTP